MSTGTEHVQHDVWCFDELPIEWIIIGGILLFISTIFAMIFGIRAIFRYYLPAKSFQKTLKFLSITSTICFQLASVCTFALYILCYRCDASYIIARESTAFFYTMAMLILYFAIGLRVFASFENSIYQVSSKFKCVLYSIGVLQLLILSGLFLFVLNDNNKSNTLAALFFIIHTVMCVVLLIILSKKLQIVAAHSDDTLNDSMNVNSKRQSSVNVVAVGRSRSRSRITSTSVSKSNMTIIIDTNNKSNNNKSNNNNNNVPHKNQRKKITRVTPASVSITATATTTATTTACPMENINLNSININSDQCDNNTMASHNKKRHGNQSKTNKQRSPMKKNGNAKQPQTRANTIDSGDERSPKIHFVTGGIGSIRFDSITTVSKFMDYDDDSYNCNNCNNTYNDRLRSRSSITTMTVTNINDAKRSTRDSNSNLNCNNTSLRLQLRSVSPEPTVTASGMAIPVPLPVHMNEDQDQVETETDAYVDDDGDYNDRETDLDEVVDVHNVTTANQTQPQTRCEPTNTNRNSRSQCITGTLILPGSRNGNINLQSSPSVDTSDITPSPVDNGNNVIDQGSRIKCGKNSFSEAKLNSVGKFEENSNVAIDDSATDHDHDCNGKNGIRKEDDEASVSSIRIVSDKEGEGEEKEKKSDDSLVTKDCKNSVSNCGQTRSLTAGCSSGVGIDGNINVNISTNRHNQCRSNSLNHNCIKKNGDDSHKHDVNYVHNHHNDSCSDTNSNSKSTRKIGNLNKKHTTRNSRSRSRSCERSKSISRSYHKYNNNVDNNNDTANVGSRQRSRSRSKSRDPSKSSIKNKGEIYQMMIEPLARFTVIVIWATVTTIITAMSLIIRSRIYNQYTVYISLLCMIIDQSTNIICLLFQNSFANRDFQKWCKKCDVCVKSVCYKTNNN